MKKTLLLLFSCLWMGSIYADTSVDYPTIFTDDNYNAYFYDFDDEAWKAMKEIHMYSCFKGWNLYLHLEDGSDVKRGCFIEYGDTLVGGNHYQKVTFIARQDIIVEDETWPKPIGVCYDTRPDCVDTLLYRQEGDKVYYRSEEGEESLILDYSLSVGDVFTNAAGERFTVTETGFFEEYNESVEYREGSALPKMLRLVAENGGQEDVWIEGLGSVNWGITPLFLTEKLKTLTATPTCSKVTCATGTDIWGVFDINKNSYKTKAFRSKWNLLWDEMETELTYTFLQDTLCVSGIYVGSISSPMYAECTVFDNNIDMVLGGVYTIISYSSEIGMYCYCEFEFKIPGFAAGTYQVGLEGGAHQALVCNPTNGIALAPAVSQGEGGVYDLSGRKVNANGNANLNSLRLKKGIYIKGRKKVMVK
ncbi:MAG: T9SS type A sorting domain-containing protein [Bacteroidaceae bacterium]|nr:T9SS type A sorting domain-containing protein [Bacteroidaceae bacterium]